MSVTSAVTNLFALGKRCLLAFPLGTSLERKDFERRHRLAQVVASGLLVLLALYPVLQGEPLGHYLLELTPMAAAIVVGHRARHRAVAALAMSAALMLAVAFLVHATEGLIESHFLFFVLLPIIALYQDIKAFLFAVAFVIFHHGVVGILAPEAVYNHPAAIENPVKYGALHGGYVLGLVIVLSIEWSFSDRAQQLAHDRARELEEMQVELVHAQKLESVGQLAAGIAHEINTPMQYIGDNTRFLGKGVERLLAVAAAAEATAKPDATDDDRARLAEALERARLPMLVERAPKAADDALSGVESVSRIVTAMKRFSHPGSDEKAPIDLNDSIETTITVCRNEWKYVAELEVDFGVLPTVSGHLGALNQVWLNLITNAAHAIAERGTEEKGTIRITTRATGDAVVVTVSDDGMGIKEEHRWRVLDPFFTTKEVGKGTGQGLAISRRVIKHDHGGRLSFESVLGEGTTFTVVLPLSKPGQELVAPGRGSITR